MLPRLVHLLGQDERPRFPDQRVAVAADPVEAGAHGGVDGPARRRLGEGSARSGPAERDPAGRARQQRVEPAATQHARYSTVQSVSVEMSFT